MRSIRYRISMREKHIERKKRICHEHQTGVQIKVDKNGEEYTVTDFSRMIPMEWYPIDGKYDKGKIHCGCSICKPTKGYRPSGKEEMAVQKLKDKEKEYLKEMYG